MKRTNSPVLWSNEVADDFYIKTLRLKVKPNACAWLNAAAREVNTVFNWCNETSMLAASRTDAKRKWLSGFDLCNLSAGATEYFEHIGADTIQRICIDFAQKRTIAKKFRLKWRKSGGARRSLGWVPFKAVNIKRKGVGLRFYGKSVRVFERELLDGLQWRDGCFAEDVCGDWWICLPVRIATRPGQQFGEVGIDLGLKDTAVTSDGEVLAAGQFYRGIEQNIAQAQRRGHKRQAKYLHRRAANRRKDALHKFTTGIARRYSAVYVGDVSSIKMAKTRMAKSTLDAGWGMLRTQLRYKCQKAGTEFAIVSERNTTRACSECGCLSGPQGLRGLVVRHWVCGDCGAVHDRDVNAARNILTAGRHARPFAGTPSICGGGAQRAVAA